MVSYSPWGRKELDMTEQLHFHFHTNNWASLMAQMVKNLPAMQETQVQSLVQEDPLEKGMATHSSILAWKIPWAEELRGLQSMELQRVGYSSATNTFIIMMMMMMMIK